MTFRVQNFVEEVSARGLARQNRFQVEITNVDFSPGGDSGTLTLLCQSASLPGATLALKKQSLFGPDYVRPASINYGDTLQMSFLCDKEMWVRNIFDLWIHRAVNMGSFTVAYKQDYVRDIIITQLDESESATYSIKLVDAFPIQIGAMALNQSALDRFHLLPVTFSYRYWETDKISNSEVYDSQVEGSNFETKKWGPKVPDNRPPNSGFSDPVDPSNIGEFGSAPPYSPVQGGGFTSGFGFGA